MAERLMGVEVEYALSPAARCEEMVRLATDRLTHLPGLDGGLYLENGSRLYQDQGHHLEVCTPEVESPDQIVRYLAANDAITAGLAADLDIELFTHNVDYQRPGVSWAFHESHLHKANPRCMPSQLLPFLVSRLYLGAGGLDPDCPGIRFSLSPRLHVFQATESRCAMSNRGIFNSRDESLSSGPYQRLHIVCGDNLRSHRAIWLRLATTDLVVAAIEAGLDPVGGMELMTPVLAMKAFAVDPTFKQTARLSDQTSLNAIALQRRYLDRIEPHINHEVMPPWAERTCTRWRQTLDAVDRGSSQIPGDPDWTIKHSLFEDHLRDRGFDPDELPHWNLALARLSSLLETDHLDPATILDQIAANGLSGSTIAQLRRRRLDPERLPDFLRARDELCEIDLRFAQLTPEGLFSKIETHLDHRVPEVNGIVEARSEPPPTGRAGLRGKTIARLADKRDHYMATWGQIISRRDRRVLDLSHPFGQTAQWSALPRPTIEGAPDQLGGDVDQRVSEVCDLYADGDLTRSYALVRSLLLRSPSDHARYRLVRYLAWINARRGRHRAALSAVARLAQMSPDETTLPLDHIAVHRFQGLVPRDARVWAWIDRCDEGLENGRLPRSEHSSYLGHKGSILAQVGRIDDALAVLTRTCELTARGGLRVRARNLCDLANALRISGDCTGSRSRYEEAREIYEWDGQGRGCARFHGDRVNHLWLGLARLEYSEGNDARPILRRAFMIQRRLGDQVGMVRSLLLQARMGSDRVTESPSHIREMSALVPDLRTCPVLESILTGWDTWTSGDELDEACAEPLRML